MEIRVPSRSQRVATIDTSNHPGDGAIGCPTRRLRQPPKKGRTWPPNGLDRAPTPSRHRTLLANLRPRHQKRARTCVVRRGRWPTAITMGPCGSRSELHASRANRSPSSRQPLNGSRSRAQRAVVAGVRSFRARQGPMNVAGGRRSGPPDGAAPQKVPTPEGHTRGAPH